MTQTEQSGSKSADAKSIVDAAQAVTNSASLETLSRPFLELLHGLTGLESTYLTEVNLPDGEQTILFADNRGSLTMPENLTVDWEDAVCRRALESGLRCTSDVDADLPGSRAAKELGLKTYVSVPVRNQDDELMGTLCGASDEVKKVAPEVLDVMEMLARLIADQWERDISHANAMERASTAEQRLRSRATFLAEAEHKLKSPLTLLRGWTEMLSLSYDDMAPEMRKDAVDTLRKASKDAVEQLDELLLEARSEVLSTQLDIVDIELDSLIEEAVYQLNGVAVSRGQSVTLGESSSTIVSGDRQALWQILWHLGDNALKYSPTGGQVQIGSTSIDDNEVLIEVTDEGIGIPADVDVFEPFTRGNSEELGAVAGSGLGLHIVRNLVQCLGGNVSAQRRPAGGSVFSVRLPQKLK